MTYDRAAIMRDAWSRYRHSQRFGKGWTFGRCLMVAWAAARLRAEFPPERYGLTGAIRHPGLTNHHFPAGLP